MIDRFSANFSKTKNKMTFIPRVQIIIVGKLAIIVDGRVSVGE